MSNRFQNPTYLDVDCRQTESMFWIWSHIQRYQKERHPNIYLYQSFRIGICHSIRPILFSCMIHIIDRFNKEGKDIVPDFVCTIRLTVCLVAFVMVNLIQYLLHWRTPFSCTYMLSIFYTVSDIEDHTVLLT